MRHRACSRIVDDAEHLYRERFLRERYGITRAETGPSDGAVQITDIVDACLLYTSPSPRDRTRSRMPSSA